MNDILEKLYLSDLKCMDIDFKKIKDKEDYKLRAKNLILNCINDIECTEDTILKDDKIDLDDCMAINGLLLNLFLRTDDIETKNKVKKLLSENDMTKFEEIVTTGFSENKPEIVDLIDKLFDDYIISQKEELKVNKEDILYILKFNDYYKDDVNRMTSYANELRNQGIKF